MLHVSLTFSLAVSAPGSGRYTWLQLFWGAGLGKDIAIPDVVGPAQVYYPKNIRCKTL